MANLESLRRQSPNGHFVAAGETWMMSVFGTNAAFQALMTTVSSTQLAFSQAMALSEPTNSDPDHRN